MAKNAAAGHGRVGRIKQRIQSLNPRSKHWVESSTKTDKFINVKSDRKPFKAVRKHK